MNRQKILSIGLMLILFSIVAFGAETRRWPNILDLDVRNTSGVVANLNLDTMNASLAANNFEPLNGSFWGFGYGSYMLTAPHNKINFGMYTTQLYKTSLKGVKKASFSMQSVALQLNREFPNGNFTFTPKVSLGVGIINLGLIHKASEDIYTEPREVLARGFYLTGSAGVNLAYNFNEIVALTASADYLGGYKLFKPIKDLDSYSGYMLSLGLSVILPL